MNEVALATLAWRDRQIRIEYQWISCDRTDRPLMVFLHEGLGSLAMWREFPQALCAAIGMRALVYSRPGYGGSTPREPGERWEVDYMHRQAYEVLPALLAALQVNEPVWLLGHSDGGSIALLYAARFAASVAGLVVLAPHIRVEALGLESIRRAREAYETTDLRARLSRYHADVDSAFWGWNRIWLDPAFEAWNIERELPAISCPVLAVQGMDDEYGSLEQIRGIARLVPQTQLLELPGCGHSPQRDQSVALIEAVRRFIAPPVPA